MGLPARWAWGSYTVTQKRQLILSDKIVLLWEVGVAVESLFDDTHNQIVQSS